MTDMTKNYPVYYVIEISRELNDRIQNLNGDEFKMLRSHVRELIEQYLTTVEYPDLTEDELMLIEEENTN